jgi:hypothetical protein
VGSRTAVNEIVINTGWLRLLVLALLVAVMVLAALVARWRTPG